MICLGSAECRAKSAERGTNLARDDHVHAVSSDAVASDGGGVRQDTPRQSSLVGIFKKSKRQTVVESVQGNKNAWPVQAPMVHVKVPSHGLVANFSKGIM